MCTQRSFPPVISLDNTTLNQADYFPTYFGVKAVITHCLLQALLGGGTLPAADAEVQWLLCTLDDGTLPAVGIS